MSTSSNQTKRCTSCCFKLEVPELHKRANERCKWEIIGSGCAIYDRRPQSCRTFECEWLKDPNRKPEERPDVKGVIWIRETSGNIRSVR